MDPASRKNPKYYVPLALAFVSASGVAFWTYCYFFCQFWTHIETEGLFHLTEYNSPHVRGDRGRQILVHREFLPTMHRLDEYARASGVKIVVVHSYRRPETVLRGEKVRPATYSNHLAGHALDVNIRCGWSLYEFEDLKKISLPLLPSRVQNFIQEIRNDPQMRWGGDFGEEDPVHLDDGLNHRDRAEWEQHREACLREISSARSKWTSRLWPIALILGENAWNTGR
jgi:hypothetical protein